MMPNILKKLIVGGLFIIIVLVVFLIGYNFGGQTYLDKTDFNDRNALIYRFNKPEEVSVGYKTIEKLPSQNVTYPFLGLDGSIIYYDSLNGYVSKIEGTSNGFRNTTLQKLQPYLSQISWSINTKKILADSKSGFVLYDIENNTSKILPKTMRNGVLSPSGKQIAYIFTNYETNERWLELSGIELNSYVKLISISDDKWQIRWLNEEKIILSYADSSLFILDLDNNNLQRITSNKTDLEINHSSNNNWLVYSYLEGDRTVLYYLDVATGKQSKLAINSSAYKCANDEQQHTLYCAVTDTESGQDDFIAITTSGTDQELPKQILQSKIKTDLVFLSADKKYIYARNALDKSIYRIHIP